MNLSPEQLHLLESALARLNAGFAELPSVEQPPLTPQMKDALLAAAERLHDNFPYHHPLYLGQMLKPPHPIAQLAVTLTMCLNPNNHALDGGRASSMMEQECVAGLARMVGWNQHLGHLCGGGTMANFEALWIARELCPGTGIAASPQAHYTHERLARVLQVPFHPVPVDERGRMRIDALAQLLESERIGTVVATLGTTGIGSVDPLDQIAELRGQHAFRLHVDAAYGGYFRLIDNLEPETRQAFEAMSLADSIAIDPHKHGLQPYGCGCVLFQDSRVAGLYKHDSPYTYYTAGELHLGEISLECSRAGAAAVALWTTMQALPLAPAGTFAQGLAQGRTAALQLAEWIQHQPGLFLVLTPQLDIVVWGIRAASAAAASCMAEQVFQAAAERDLHLALVKLPGTFGQLSDVVNDSPESVTCLRACVMKSEHLDWMPEILTRLTAATDAVLSK